MKHLERQVRLVSVLKFLLGMNVKVWLMQEKLLQINKTIFYLLCNDDIDKLNREL